jgi:DNA-directed RNA polymerase specialized sigma24 family protein
MAKNHYVNNEDFLQAMIEFKENCELAKVAGKPRPVIPDYIAKCIMMIAEKLSRKPNFYSYTFREDMVGDAIKNCILYIDNFDPTIGRNPFAYFTQIIYFAFIQRINKERKQLYVKYKSTEELSILGDYEQFELSEMDGEGEGRQFELYENISEFIDNYEEKNNIKKVTKKKKQKERELSLLEELFEEEEDLDKL